MASHSAAHQRPCRTRKAPERYRGDITDVSLTSKQTSKTHKFPTDPLKPVGYASRLSEYNDYGKCGVSEKPDNVAELEEKISKLAALVKEAPHVVVHTGAGMSTSAGIPDFRGKDGVWTRHLKGEPLPASERCWNNAQPTYGHMALAALVQHGIVHMIVTQNIDGLHRRSNVPSEKLAELHGNIFREKCKKCAHVVTRSFDCGGVGFKPTGRACHKCGGVMIDQLLDWEDDLPPDEFEKAEDHTVLTEQKGGLALCLGTSMQMTPARDWPCRASNLVIVNLQPTVRDHVACLVIRAKIDDVLKLLVEKLNSTLTATCTTKPPIHTSSTSSSSSSSSSFCLPVSSQIIKVPAFFRSESFIIKQEMGRNDVENEDMVKKFEITICDKEGAPCGFILHVDIETSQTLNHTTSSSLQKEGKEEEMVLKKRLEHQPFVYHGSIFEVDSVFNITICFDRVPIDGVNFYQPPEQVIKFKVSNCSSTNTYSVDLSPLPP